MADETNTKITSVADAVIKLGPVTVICFAFLYGTYDIGKKLATVHAEFVIETMKTQSKQSETLGKLSETMTGISTGLTAVSSNQIEIVKTQQQIQTLLNRESVRIQP